MDEKGSEIEIVTAPDGVFLGTLARQDADSHLAGTATRVAMQGRRRADIR
jgi:hypothetical protein